MLISRKPRTEEEDNLSNKILEEYGIEDEFTPNSIKYLIFLDDNMVGVSKVEYHDGIGILKYVAIRKEETGDDLGDALLRATFNNCLNNKIEKIYYPTVDSYLLKFGFIEKENILNVNGDRQDFLLEIDLESFFTSPCKSSKGIK